MTIKNNQYIFQGHSGVWIFQVFVPAYMRYLCENKWAWRKSIRTKDIIKVRHFISNILIKLNNIKALLNPDREDIRIQNTITTLHTTIKQPKSIPVAISPLPTLVVMRDEYMMVYNEQ